LKTAYVICSRTRPTGEPCGVDAALLESRYTCVKARSANGKVVDQLQRIEYDLDCPMCGDHWEIVRMEREKAASA
jgi:hypothetical protein